MDDMPEEAVVQVEFFEHLLHIKIFTCIPRLVPFDLGPWKFMLGWRYNPNSTCLSILHFFTSQILTELKNINVILKQLQKSNIGWTIRRSLQLTSSCHISSGCGSFILISCNSTSCSTVANCITGLLTTVIPCPSNTSVSLFGYCKSLLVQIQQRQRHKYFMIQLAYHEKTYNSKER